MKSSLRIALVAFGLLLAMSGCHPRTPLGDGRTARSVKVCELLTRADAESFFAAPVHDEKETISPLTSGGPPYMICTYVGIRNPAGTPFIQMAGYDTARFVEQGYIRSTASEFFRETMKEKMARGVPLSKVAGLGDEAYWERGSDYLHVLKREVYLRIFVDKDFELPLVFRSQIMTERGKKRLEAAKKLMQETILPRLDKAMATSGS